MPTTDTFSIGEIVRSRGSKRPERLEGVIKHITCQAATGAGGGTCDRSTCPHTPKDRVWVKWPDGGLCSYQVHELETDLEGEEGVLKTMGDLLKSNVKEDVEDATTVVKTILQARKNRAENPAKKEEAKMSSSGAKSFMEMIKNDGGNAAYRVAARQINNGIRTALCELVKSKGGTNSNVEAMALFLETELGAALLGTIAGHGLSYIPGIKDDPRVIRLAKEFRISSMTTVGNELFEAALGQLLPVVKNALEALPEENSVVQNTEGHKSSTEEPKELDIEVEEDLSALEEHLEQEDKRMVINGKG